MPRTSSKIIQQAGKRIFPLLEFPLAWALTLAFTLLDQFWIAASGLHLPSPWNSWAYFAIFFYAKILYRFFVLGKVLQDHHLNAFLEKCFLATEYVMLFEVSGTALCLVSYLVYSWHYPLADAQLNRIDQALGFDWLWLFHHTQNQIMKIIFFVFYNSMIPQNLFLAFWLAFRHNRQRLTEIFYILFLSLAATVFISGLVPAFGPVHLLGLEAMFSSVENNMLADIAALHSDYAGHVVFTNLNGIVTFPSFHTVGAIVLIYAFRNSGPVGVLMTLINMVMLITIPTFGGHYLIDMVGGAAVAWPSILLVRFMMKKYGPVYRQAQV